MRKPVISADEYADRIAADWPPLDDEGFEVLARVYMPLVKARAECRPSTAA